MKPLFTDAQDTRVADPAQGFQPIVTQQPSYPVAAAPSQSVTTGRVITDEMIDKLGQENAAAVAAVTQKILANVKASDTEEMGKALNAVVAQAKKLDPNKLGKPGLLGRLLGAGGDLKGRMFAEFSSVETQMNRLVKELDDMAKLMDQRVKDCDTLFDDNERAFHKLGADIEVGKQMMAEIEAQIAASGTPKDGFQSQKLADLQARYQRLEKRIDDFARGQQLALIAAPDIRNQQGLCRSLVATTADIKVTTIPAFMGCFTRYIIGLEAAKGAELLNSVRDATEAAFRTQATQMRENTRMIATAQQQSVVTVETLEHMQTELLGALDDARKIAEDGRKARADAKPKLQRLEQELVNRFAPANLLSHSTN